MILTHRERRPDIDWLRVLATLLVVVFHTAMVFNPAPFYHLRNSDHSFAILVFCGFVGLWHMPLFFVLAGWSLGSAIGTRGGSEIVRERLLRLGLPLVTGVVLFMPWIKYIELRGGMDLNHRGLWVAPRLQEGLRQILPVDLPVMTPFHETFGQFLPRFFTVADRFSWGHLWFLAYLLTFTLVLLPLLLRWARRPRPTAPWPATIVWAPIVPLLLVQVFLRPHWPGIQNLYNDWANVAWYAIYLGAGFALAWDPRLEALVHGQWKRGLALGLGTCAVLLGGLVGLYTSDTVMLIGSAVAGWSFLVALLGMARERLFFSTPTLRYLSEGALAIYVLHQAAIVIPGWWVVDLPLGVLPKFVVLLSIALTLTLGLYHFVVRPVQPLRILFGMRPLACPLPRRPVAAAAVTGLAMLVFLGDPAQADPSPVGLWYAEGGAAKVRVQPCGDALCGRVVWLRSPFDEQGCALSDRQNPDDDLRARSLVGIDILSGLKPVGTGTWDGGTIYDPTSGRSYSCTMSLDGRDRLHVRGYLGWRVLGRTTTWIRVGTENQTCRLPDHDGAGS